ncbi:MAG TPA: phage portal protein [Bacteroidales bacterium]|nr:phage portal protein [Bacteroidales bacterium]
MNKKRHYKPEIKLNFIDRVLEYIAPVHAARRFRSRAFMSFAGGYIGARTDRRPTKEWITSGRSADSDILPDLPLLRQRSRDLIRNAPLAGGAINTTVTNVVGTGLKLNSRIDRDVVNMNEEEANTWELKTEREWRLFADSSDCVVSRNMNFTSIQDLVFRQVLENGDSISLLPRISRKDQPYTLRIQVIESDRLCNKDRSPDTDLYSGGIKKNNYGAPIEYHILKQHPGNIYRSSKWEWETVPAFGKNTGLRNIIHLYKVLRPGQTRGVPFLAPVIEPIKQITRYSEAEIDATVISAMYTVFIKTESGDSDFAPMHPTSETGGRTDDEDYKLASGAILGLAPGEEIQIANPGRPNPIFDQFVQSCLRQIGVALEIPFEILIKHFTASYSAARAALLEAWKFFQSRRKWLSDNFCQVIYEIWMYEAVAKGRIAAPGYFQDPIMRMAYHGSEWTGPTKGMIDELKEVNAAGRRIELGLSTRAYETAQITGLDYEKVHQQQVKENKMRKELMPEQLNILNKDDDKPDDKGDLEDETQ